MKWEKLGQIFKVAEHSINGVQLNFAQSPQAISFEDKVRIYFSTRRVDPNNGKFFSDIAYVDFDKNLSKLINVSSNPVIELGKLGTFDEHGIFPISPVRDKDKILAYTCGWSRRKSVSVETSTGLAISYDNGETFQKYSDGPILSCSLNEPFLVGDSFVLIENGIYHMWYIYGVRWIDNPYEETARVYKIGYAHSKDGVNWIKLGKNIIEDIIDENECQALPSVVKINDTYHMFFCYRNCFGFRTDPKKGYRLGYATSKDCINWNRVDELSGISASDNDWDSLMMCYPNIFKTDKDVFLLYNGNEFGKHGFGAAKLIEI